MMSCSEPGVYAISMLYKGECLLNYYNYVHEGRGGDFKAAPNLPICVKQKKHCVQVHLSIQILPL